MVYVVMALIVALVVQTQARKAGQSRTKWFVIGFVVAITPALIIPHFLHRAIGRSEFDGVAILLGIIGAMGLSAAMRRKAQPDPSSKPPEL